MFFKTEEMVLSFIEAAGSSGEIVITRGLIDAIDEGIFISLMKLFQQAGYAISPRTVRLPSLSALSDFHRAVGTTCC